MLKKLLKYDFKATKRIAIPVIIAIIGITVLASLDLVALVKMIFSLGENGEPGPYTTIWMMSSVMFLFSMIMGLAACISVVSIYILVNFYKTLLSDEGYLTFTLPVKSSALLASKLINSILWQLIIGAVLFASLIIMIVTVVLALPEEAMGGTSGDSTMLGEINGAFVVNMIINIITMFVTMVMQTLLYFLAIFVGATIVRKHKVLAAIGGVLIADFAYGVVSSIVSVIVSVTTSASAAMVENPYIPMNIIGAIMIVLELGACVGLFYLTTRLMERKLNLA